MCATCNTSPCMGGCPETEENQSLLLYAAAVRTAMEAPIEGNTLQQDVIIVLDSIKISVTENPLAWSI